MTLMQRLGKLLHIHWFYESATFPRGPAAEKTCRCGAKLTRSEPYGRWQ